MIQTEGSREARRLEHSRCGMGCGVGHALDINMQAWHGRAMGHETEYAASQPVQASSGEATQEMALPYGGASGMRLGGRACEPKQREYPLAQDVNPSVLP
jgi:hypothetical protein